MGSECLPLPRTSVPVRMSPPQLPIATVPATGAEGESPPEDLPREGAGMSSNVFSRPPKLLAPSPPASFLVEDLSLR